MISPLVLERAGHWRGALCLLLLALVLAPILPLIAKVGVGPVGPEFWPSLGRSVATGAGVSVLSLILGLPLGVLAAIYRFAGRGPLLGLSALPMLVPSFIWALGISELRLPFGSVLAFSTMGFSLVLWVAFGAARLTTRGQADAARLVGGERAMLALLFRETLPLAALAAIFVGVWTLSDPGPGQILGSHGAASEILVSFSALYDFDLAARQCLLLGLAVLVLVGPFAPQLGERLGRVLMAREQAALRPLRPKYSPAWVFAPALGLLVIPPLLGWLRPLLRSFPLERAWIEVARTLGNTVLYAGGSGVIATGLGFSLAIAAGRGARTRGLLLAVVLVAFSLPSSLAALGLLSLSASASVGTDFLLRSRFTVTAALGLRLLPVAFLVGLNALGSSSPSWAEAATVHGVSLARYGWGVLLPGLGRPALQSLMVVSLLACAEVGPVLLLRPPGEDSLPVAIFTVMANAPEAFVASLCLIYFAGALALLALAGVWLTRRTA